MDYMRIGRLLESDFDGIVEVSGGQRLSKDDSREEAENCDYALGNAVLELKIVEEEGLEKATRQKKMADLFLETQQGKPTVVLDPALLGSAGQRKYYTMMATPIKTHVKKASKQLGKSAPLIGPDAPRVLVLINGGYGALSHDEFREIAVNRCVNDTTGIDALIVGGCYPNLYVSARVASVTEQRADYIRNRGLDDAHYVRLVLEYLSKYGSATRDDINKLLLPKLPDILDHGQKQTKIASILSHRMRRDLDLIANRGTRACPRWELTEAGRRRLGHDS